MKIVLTDGWTKEQAEHYREDVFGAFGKLVEERPLDLTVPFLVWTVCRDGERNNLWLVLDDDDRFLSFFMTRIETCDATQVRSVKVLNMAGEGGRASVEAIAEAVTPWAKERGATQAYIEGRDGWWPALKANGFTRDAVQYRKELA